MKTSRRRSDRGSVLIVALLLGTLIGISLGTYVALNNHSLKMASRSFYASEAVNMAEAGVEEAAWSFNQFQGGDTHAWDGWNTSDGITATRTFADFSLAANATGSVKVYIDHYNPAAGVQPKAVAQASVILPGGQGVLTKMVEVLMKRRSFFANGLVARNSIRFSGNHASVDSWNSDPDNNPATPAIPYSGGVRRDKGSVAGASVTSTIAVGNAEIWGTASVGGASATAISVGSQGAVGPFGTTNGVKNPDSIATDFIANMDGVTAPTSGTNLGAVGSSLGADGTTTSWRAPAISENLTIHGNVTLVLTAGPGVPAIDLTGNKGITLAAGATLVIYTEGDVKIAGNGLLNNNDRPDTFQLWGTSTSAVPQDIQIAGNGALKGIIYAPNGNIKINGNGDMMGAAVGGDITLVGDAAFHYDESLVDWGVNTPFGILKWRELVTAADRATYATQLAF